MKLLVMFGFCLVAAISSTAFIRTLSDRVLSEAKQAKSEVLEAGAEDSEVHQAIQPIVDKGRRVRCFAPPRQLNRGPI